MGWNSEERILPKERCNKRTRLKERIRIKRESSIRKNLGKKKQEWIRWWEKKQEKAVSIRMMKEDEIRKEEFYCCFSFRVSFLPFSYLSPHLPPLIPFLLIAFFLLLSLCLLYSYFLSSWILSSCLIPFISFLHPSCCCFSIFFHFLREMFLIHFRLVSSSLSYSSLSLSLCNSFYLSFFPFFPFNRNHRQQFNVNC